jgi:tetratricopeptide (TPR) repeat protein
LELRKPEEAARLLEMAQASGERAGEDAVREAQHLEIVAVAADERDAYAEEAARCGEAAALYHRASRPISEAAVLGRKGWALSKAGRFDEGAHVCADALGLIEKTLGGAHPIAIQSLNCLANIAEERDHPDEAVAWLKRALSITEATYHGSGPRVVSAWGNLGEALNDRGDYEEALAAFGKSERAAQGAQLDPRDLVCIQMGTGLALYELGRAQESISLLEAGHQWLSKSSTDKDALARSTFALARALFTTGRDRARALRFGHEAAAFAAGRPPSPYTTRLRDQISAWLRAHE